MPEPEAPKRPPALSNAERAERIARLLIELDLVLDFGTVTIKCERHRVATISIEEMFKPTLTTPTVQQVA